MHAHFPEQLYENNIDYLHPMEPNLDLTHSLLSLSLPAEETVHGISKPRLLQVPAVGIGSHLGEALPPLRRVSLTTQEINVPQDSQG